VLGECTPAQHPKNGFLPAFFELLIMPGDAST
jgi:hypothetical protein